jgi:glucose/arabinose dehydrogenase
MPFARRICLVGTGILLAAMSVVLAQTVPAPLTVQTVATGLSSPTGMVFLTPNDILVIQKNDGRVRRVLSGVLQATAVLDVPVNAENERGLLGIALDPDFPHNQYVYLHYTEAAVDGATPIANRTYRYTWNGSALVAPQLVLDLPAGVNYHNGGVIQFGPDDKLYLINGDLEHNGKLQNNPTGSAPDNTSGIFRVDRSGAGVVDNPFYDTSNLQNVLNRYYAYGIRNSFGLTFDPVTHGLWDTENGPDRMDEINRVTAGWNSGWRPLMGPDSRSASSPSDLWYAPGATYSDPEFSWLTTIAPTSLAFVASRRLGCAHELRLLVGNANCGTLQEFDLDASRANLAFTSQALQDKVADNAADRCGGEQAELAFGTNFGLITDIENGSDGFVYVLSMTNGAIYRIRPGTVAGDIDGDLVPGTCDCNDGNAGAWAPPQEVVQLRVSDGAALQLGWDDQAGVAGSGTSYTVVSGRLSDLRANASYTGACTLGTISARSTSDVRSDPPTADAYYYLVRAGNTCSAGTYGDSAMVPDPRDLLDASSPPACN